MILTLGAVAPPVAGLLALLLLGRGAGVLATLLLNELVAVLPVLLLPLLSPLKLAVLVSEPVGALLTKELLFISPCSISARFLALAWLKRNTRKPPSWAAGITSSCLTNSRIRSRLRASPFTNKRLLRPSAIRRKREPRTSRCGVLALIASIRVIISSAWVFCSGIMSRRSVPPPSKFCTKASSWAILPARSDTKSALVPGTAAKCANCGIKGRIAGIKSFGLVFSSQMTRVTTSSSPARLRRSNGTPACLAFTSGTSLTVLPDAIATTPLTFITPINRSYTSVLLRALLEITVILPLTRGSTTKFLPVISATSPINAVISASRKLIFHVCACTGNANAISNGLTSHNLRQIGDRPSGVDEVFSSCCIETVLRHRQPAQ